MPTTPINSASTRQAIVHGVTTGNTTPARARPKSGTSNPTTPAPTSTAMPHNPEGNAASNLAETVLNFLPNPLDSFDVVTYHWKLFITSLENASTGEILTLSNQVVIAESGVTDLTIDKVELHGIAVPSVEAGTGTQTAMKFEIVEPAGAGLIDKMFYEAVGLGIGNWLVMPVYLQLEFRGRNAQTGQSNVSTASASGLTGQRWVWPIKITNVKANVTQVGTRYEFDAIMYDELAQSNSYFGIQHNIVLNDVSTFASAMADLENKLNEDQFEKLIDNYSIPDTYKIIVDPVIANAATALVPDEKKNSSRGGDYIDFNKKSASFAAGTGIDKIVDSLLANSTYFAAKLQSSTTPSGQPDTLTQQTDQMKQLWRIVTETRPIAFDSLRQNNAVAITIWITEYNIGSLLADAAQSGGTSNTISTEVKRFNEYAKKRIMSKVYNYIFTGLNDQILNFDLNMNFSFAAALARFGGYYINSTSHDKGVKQIDIDNQKNAATQLRETLQFINNAKPNTNVQDKIDAAAAAISKATVDGTTQARYKNLLAYAKPNQPLNFTQITQSIQASGGLSNDGTPATTSNLPAIQNLAKTIGSTPNIPAFISDVQTNSATAQQARNVFDNISGGKLRPVVFAETNQDQNVGQGVEATNDPSRARLSSLFSTALYSTLDASLQYVKITIKGDPFWLFPGSINTSQDKLIYKSSLSPDQAFAIIKNSKNVAPGDQSAYANIFGTDNFIVVRFRTPSIYTQPQEPGAGATTRSPLSEGAMDTVDTFSGVYRVITVISKFEGGKFTQEINCQLDPVINVNIDQIRIQIEQAIQNSSPVNTISPVPTPAPASVLATAKTQTIVSNTTNFPPGTTPNYPAAPSQNVGPYTGAFQKGVSNIPSYSDSLTQTITGKTFT